MSIAFTRVIPKVEPASQNALQMTLIDPSGNRLHFRELIGS
jgi:hypothetical protein